MLDANALAIDPAAAADDIAARLRRQVLGSLRRRGVVIGISGGIDSAVVAALASRAVGPERVLALLMPERDSADESLTLGRLVATRLGVEALCEDIAPILRGAGCYARQDDAVRQVFPAYGEGWRCKISLPTLGEGERFNLFSLTVQRPSGDVESARLPLAPYLQLVAATNFKQRARKMLEYYHADRLAYAVAGTPNKLEYDLGFFVKQGDGAADVKPIAHLYKTQVYTLAHYLGIPEEICARPPTTDTYSMAQTQEEFFFSLPYQRMDLCLFALDHGVAAAEVAAAVDLSPAQVEAVFNDIRAKRRAARYQHRAPMLIDEA